MKRTPDTSSERLLLIREQHEWWRTQPHYQIPFDAIDDLLAMIEDRDRAANLRPVSAPPAEEEMDARLRQLLGEQLPAPSPEAIVVSALKATARFHYESRLQHAWTLTAVVVTMFLLGQWRERWTDFPLSLGAVMILPASWAMGWAWAKVRIARKAMGE